MTGTVEAMTTKGGAEFSAEFTVGVAVNGALERVSEVLALSP